MVGQSNWGERFDKVLSRSRVIEVSQERLGNGGLSYDYANMVLQGQAKIHADQLNAELFHLAVWNGEPGDGLGGTESSVERWRNSGYPVSVVDNHTLDVRVLEPTPGSPLPVRSTTVATDGSDARIVTFFFADVVGFSKLEERQLVPFKDHFLKLIARLIDDLPSEAVLKRNTWGDAVYLVFEEVRTAGRFALELRDRIAATDWTQFGLPEALNMRIGLHVGPAIYCEDPVTRRPRYLGSHISQAARIEPIVPPGQVYASRAFASLAAAARHPRTATKQGLHMHLKLVELLLLPGDRICKDW